MGALNNLGVAYLDEEGIERDYDKAVKLFKEAAEKGFSQAMSNLASCYINGNGVDKNAETAEKWIIKALDKNYDNPILMNNLGMFFLELKNINKALIWLKKAAEKGEVTAQYNLAHIFLYKEDYKNPLEAEKWIKMAADQGKKDSVMLNNLSFFFLDGVLVEKDLSKAFFWNKMAADLGNSKVEYNLGYKYFKGIGTEQDLSKAKFYFEKAAQKGIQLAKDHLLLIEEKYEKQNYLQSNNKNVSPNIQIESTLQTTVDVNRGRC